MFYDRVGALHYSNSNLLTCYDVLIRAYYQCIRFLIKLYYKFYCHIVCICMYLLYTPLKVNPESESATTVVG